jgi:hypothetical protein
MLFRSLGFAGENGAAAGGIGLVEIILIAGILYGIWWYLKKIRREAQANAGAYNMASMAGTQQAAYGPSAGQPLPEAGIDMGISHIRQIDGSFDEQKFKENGWRPCAHTSRTRASRWSGTMAITVTSPVENARQKARDDLIPFIPDPVENNKALRKNRARLIQKIGACPGEGRER